MLPRRLLGLLILITLCLAAINLVSTPQAANAAPAYPDVIRSLQFEGFLGGSPDEFQRAFHLDTDNNYNLYVSDLDAHKVFRYDANGAFVRTYGTGGTGLNVGDIPAPEGAAVIGGVLYVLDNTDDRVQGFNMDTGAAGGLFALPPGVYYGLAAGPDGNLYIGSWSDDGVLVYTTGGSYVRTIGTAGSGDGQFNDPGDVAFDSLGYLYVTDKGNDRVQKFNRSGTFIRQIGVGVLDFPDGLCVDRADVLWVVDRNHDRIVKFDQKGNQVGLTTAAVAGIDAQPGGLPNAGTIAVVEPPNSQPLIYVSDLTNLTVSRFHPVAVPVAHPFEAKLIPGFYRPQGIGVDRYGNVYVVDQGCRCVQKFDRYSNYLLAIGGPGAGSGQLDVPDGLALDNQRDLLYVTDWGYYAHRVTVFTTSGRYVRRWGYGGTGDGEFSIPKGVALDEAGNVYVADYGNDRIQKFDAYGNFIAKWGTTGSANGQLDGPTSVAVDSSRGMVYVAEYHNNRVQVFTTTGTPIAIYASSTSGSGQLDAPAGLALDRHGSLYVADDGHSRVAQFDTNGNYLASFGSYGAADGQFVAGPIGVAIDPATGQLYTTEQAGRVQRFGSPNVKYDTVGIYRPAAKTFYLRKQNTTGFADIAVNLGSWAQSTDLAVSGDWNCDGIDTVGLYRQSNGTFYLRDNNRAGDPHYIIPFGAPGDLPVVGDWNGDGCDGIGVYRPAQSLFYLKNVVEPGPVDVVMTLGASTDRPIAGDWNGDGQDTLGVYRPSQSRFFLSDQYLPFGSLTAQYNVLLGNPNDVGFSGDFIEQGSSGVGVFRPTNGITYLKYQPTSGFANVSMIYGIAGDGIVAGEWGVVPGESIPPAAPQESAPIFEPGK